MLLPAVFFFSPHWNCRAIFQVGTQNSSIMTFTRRQLCVAAGALAVGSAGCLGGDDASVPERTDAIPEADTPIETWSWDGSLPVSSLTQYHDPTCGCCEDYVAYLAMHDIDVTVERTDDLAAKKTELGVPSEMRSCHTLVFDEYLVEGHVPLEAIEQLFEEEPAVAGIAIPGMPAESPGMGEPGDPLQVYSFDEDGTVSEFTTV